MKGNVRRKILSVVLALAIVAGLAAGGVALWQRQSQKTVNVYAVSEFAMEEYWGDSNSTDGSVGVEGLQTVYLSDTQTVKEILVNEGDTVKEGDPLLTYDTTLTEIDLKKKNVSVQQLQLDLTAAEKELAVIKTYRPGVNIPGSTTTTVIPGIPAGEEEPFMEDGTVPLLGGTGTLEDPFIYQWDNKYSYNDAFLYQCTRGLKDAYVLFLAPGEEQEEHVADTEENGGWYADAAGHWKVCSDCGERFEESEHDYEWMVDQEPTPTQEGLRHQVCTICGYEGPEETIPVVDHDHESNGDWYSDGSSHWKECQICGEKFDQHAHNYEWVVDREATQLQEGSRHQECKDCGAQGKTESIPKKDHVHTAGDAWQSDAVGHWKECSVCGEKMDQGSHDLQWKSDESSHWQECAKCGYRTGGESHQSDGQWYDCGESGHRQKCAVCGSWMGDTQAHDTDQVHVDVPPTETEAGQGRTQCAQCGYLGETVTIPATGGESQVPPASNPTVSTTQPEDTADGQTGEEDPLQDATAAVNGREIQTTWSVQIQNQGGAYTIQLLSVQMGSLQRILGSALPPLPEEEPMEGTEDEVITDGIKYTAEEIASMRREAEMKVKETDLALRQAQLEYQKAEEELNNGAVYAKLDGQISGVLSPEESTANGEPVLKVTAGGGFYIQGTVSELMRDTVQVGDTVTIQAWESGITCEGTVQELSDYPDPNQNWWNGNSNVSGYPFTVFVPADAGLREGEWVQIDYGSSARQQSGSFYLYSMFIRSENGRSYVYLRDGDGKLKKTYINTGKTVDGGYSTEIRGGLTMGDYVAFPYGDNLKDGAATQEASADQLYNGV